MRRRDGLKFYVAINNQVTGAAIIKLRKNLVTVGLFRNADSHQGKHTDRVIT